MSGVVREELERRLTLHRARSAAWAGELEAASALLEGLEPGRGGGGPGGDGPPSGEPDASRPNAGGPAAGAGGAGSGGPSTSEARANADGRDTGPDGGRTGANELRPGRDGSQPDASRSQPGAGGSELEPGAGGLAAEVLDLRARVRAQRGEYEAADADWARVLGLRPGDPGAVAGRAALARVAAGRRVRPVYTPARAVGVLATALLVASTAAVVWVGVDGGEPSGDPVAGLRREVVALRAERDARTVADTRQREARAEAAARERERVDEVASAFAGLPGVRVERRATDVRLVFTDGLFRSSTELTAAAGSELAAVGRRLARLDVVTTVVGHTVAVPGGRTSGGSVVGYGRAQVAARELAAASGRPLAGFVLVSAEQTDGPFPDARRNRTVTILLRPA